MKRKTYHVVPPNLNYKLEIKQFSLVYLKILFQTIVIPLVVILMPVLTFYDCLSRKFKGNGYFTELYLRYVALTNMRANLP